MHPLQVGDDDPRGRPSSLRASAPRAGPWSSPCRRRRRWSCRARWAAPRRRESPPRSGWSSSISATPRRQVVRVADGEVHADHVLARGHARVERCRSSVVAPAHADPGGARRAFSTASLAANFIARCPMPLSPFTSAIAALALDADLRPRVHARLDAPDVLRQAGRCRDRRSPAGRPRSSAPRCLRHPRRARRPGGSFAVNFSERRRTGSPIAPSYL